MGAFFRLFTMRETRRHTEQDRMAKYAGEMICKLKCGWCVDGVWMVWEHVVVCCDAIKQINHLTYLIYNLTEGTE